jgi:hypothetical protein
MKLQRFVASSGSSSQHPGVVALNSPSAGKLILVGSGLASNTCNVAIVDIASVDSREELEALTAELSTLAQCSHALMSLHVGEARDVSGEKPEPSDG